MIKEILEQLAPLDAQIAALKGRGNDMEAITAHASELAELAVEEDEILRTCGPLTAEDRVVLARHPERPHIDEIVNALFTDFFEQRGDRQCKEDPAILGGNVSHAYQCQLYAYARGADCTSTGGNRLRYCVTRGNKVLYRAVACRWLLLYEQPENRLSVSTAFDRLGRMWQAGALAQPS